MAPPARRGNGLPRGGRLPARKLLAPRSTRSPSAGGAAADVLVPAVVPAVHPELVTRVVALGVEGGHVRLAGLLAEDQQVGLPVPERLAPRDLGRPVLDPALARDGGAARPAAVAAPASPPGLGQVAVEAVLAALRAVHVPVDGLVADRRPAVRLAPETPRDL